MSNPENLPDRVKKTIYWSRVGIGVRKGLKMHWQTGQLFPPDKKAEYLRLLKNPAIPQEVKMQSGPWRNITEHCLVQVARAETLARWIGLPEDVIKDIRTAEILEDYSKRREMEKTKKAEGGSPLEAYKKHVKEASDQLREAGFSVRVIYFTNSPGGHVSELLKTREILEKKDLSANDWGYLIVHYIDDCSIDSDCILPMQTDPTGVQKNIVDFKSEQNKAKAAYGKILEEIGEELKGTVYEGRHNQDVMTELSHEIERRLARRIFKKTGIKVNPFSIPEIIDLRINESIQSIVLKPNQSPS